MKLLKRTQNNHDVNIPNLLERNGVTTYHLEESKYITHGKAFEIYWYEYKKEYYFVFKHLNKPHHLFFIKPEDGEVFMRADFDYYLDHGEFKDEWSFKEVLEIWNQNKKAPTIK